MLKIEEFLSGFYLDDRTKEMLSNVWLEIEKYVNRLHEYPKHSQSIFLRDYLIKEIPRQSHS